MPGGNQKIQEALAAIMAQRARDKLDRVMRSPEEADRIAEEMFPGDARDESKKNAFRHALGTGMLAHELGGGYTGAAGAKGAGYLWELLGMGNSEDTRHDLNANAIGAAESVLNPDRAALIEALMKQVQAAQQSPAPGITERSPGYLTYSK